MKYLVIALLLMGSISHAADFTITVQAQGSSGKKPYFIKKSNNQNLGEYVFLGGQHSVKLSDGNLQLTQQFAIVFSNNNCTGTMYVQGTGLPVGTLFANNGSNYFKVDGAHSAVLIGSRIQATNPACEVLSATLSVAPISAVVDTTNLVNLTGSSSQGLFDSSFSYLKTE